MSVRVVIADDQALVRSGLRLILEAQPDLDVVGEAGDGVEAVQLAREHAPDVVLMDIQMPRMDGIVATGRVCALPGRAPRVLVLTTFDQDDHLYDAARAGATGFLFKTAPPEQLVAAVRAAAAGETLLAPSITPPAARRVHQTTTARNGRPARGRHAHRPRARGPGPGRARAVEHRGGA